MEYIKCGLYFTKPHYSALHGGNVTGLTLWRRAWEGMGGGAEGGQRRLIFRLVISIKGGGGWDQIAKH